MASLSIATSGTGIERRGRRRRGASGCRRCGTARRVRWRGGRPSGPRTSPAREVDATRRRGLSEQRPWLHDAGFGPPCGPAGTRPAACGGEVLAEAELRLAGRGRGVVVRVTSIVLSAMDNCPVTGTRLVNERAPVAVVQFLRRFDGWRRPSGEASGATSGVTTVGRRAGVAGGRTRRGCAGASGTRPRRRRATSGRTSRPRARGRAPRRCRRTPRRRPRRPRRRAGARGGRGCSSWGFWLPSQTARRGVAVLVDQRAESREVAVPRAPGGARISAAASGDEVIEPVAQHLRGHRARRRFPRRRAAVAPVAGPSSSSAPSVTGIRRSASATARAASAEAPRPPGCSGRGARRPSTR